MKDLCENSANQTGAPAPTPAPNSPDNIGKLIEEIAELVINITIMIDQTEAKVGAVENNIATKVSGKCGRECRKKD